MLSNSTFVSSFSLEHTWDINWKIVPSNTKYDRPFETKSIKEQKALEAIASVGVIGSAQLRRLFKLDKKRIKIMVGRKMIVRHELYRNQRLIPVYTIGKAGANRVMPTYIENYWLEWTPEEVLKRLLFFQLCYLFENIKIMPAPSPFIGTIEMKKNPFFVYVTRGKVDDLSMFLKWQPMTERMIIITENLNHLKPIEMYIPTKNLKVRAITDELLMSDNPYFYCFKKDEEEYRWVVE